VAHHLSTSIFSITYLSSDFNFAPNDPAYSLLVGDPVLPSQEELLASSRVVHVTIDPNQTEDAATKTTTDEDEGAQQDPDRVITRARLATFEDGLLSTVELSDLAASYGPLKSCYDEGQKTYKASHLIPTYGDRVPIEGDRRGRFEPEWTSYTHYWKTVLG
jgi:RNA exonuclease NGL2